MKKLAAIAVVLALPAIALATGTNIYFDPDNIWDTPPGLSGTLTLNIYVDLAYGGNNQIDGALYMDHNESALTFSSITYASPFSSYGFYSNGVNQPISAGTAMTAHPDFGKVSGGTGTLASAGDHQLFATIILSGFNTLPLDRYVISIGNGTNWYDETADAAGMGPFWTSSADQGVPAVDPGAPVAFDSVGTFVIDIPEPATLLLLAGALPFLRRRTV